MKNNLQYDMQITFYLMTTKNIDFYRVFHMIMYR